MTWVLGLGGSNHDFSATLLKNGWLRTAIEDERITRHRYGDAHWASCPCRPSMNYCLKTAGIDLQEIGGLFVSSDIEGNDRFWERYPHQVVGHHLCHAAAAYYPSPFDEAGILVIDGRGGPISDTHGGQRTFETISMGTGEGPKLSLDTVQTGQQAVATSTWSYISSNSIGWFYSIVTEAIGLGENGEGKTMALAAFGRPTFLDRMNAFVRLSEDTVFEMDPYGGLWDFLIEALRSAPQSFMLRADLASSAQFILEEAVLIAGRQARKRSNKRFLAYGGGVALNGIANHRLRSECDFDAVFVFPASGDNGLSCGAALYGAFNVVGEKRPPPSWAYATTFAFGGRSYSPQEIEAAYANAPVAVISGRSNSDNAKTLVDRLIGGHVVAVFRGGAEFGPRALGNRSLLALPSTHNIQERVNSIKQREKFRPFAPIVLEEKASEYFDLSGPSPFMLDIAPIRSAHLDKLAGVAHIDGTARVQTVGQTGSDFIREVLFCLAARGEPPVLLNTSFNLKGRPIVETPRDAVAAFITLDVDALLIEDTWLEKQTVSPLLPTGLSLHAY